MAWNLSNVHQRVREFLLRRRFAGIEDPTLRRLSLAVASLPDRQHEVFRLARFEGLFPHQIAQRMGISEAQAFDELSHAIGMVGASVRRQERKGW